MSDLTQPEWLKNHVPIPIEGPGNPAWQKGGPSPNPAGKPKGAYSKRDKIAHALNGDGAAVVRVVIDAALAGDMQAAGLVLSRLTPTIKAQSERVQFHLDPELPIGKQIEAVLFSVASGEVPPDTGQQIITMIGTLSNVRKNEELEQRLMLLEARPVNQ